MKNLSLRTLLLLSCVTGIWMAGEVDAAERVPALREPVYRQLSAAREHADKDDLAGALKVLDKLNAQQNLNSYERAMTWNLYAFVHYSRQDHAKATAAYREVLAQRPIPESLRNATLFGLAQMLVATEQYQPALDALKEWFALVDEPNPNAVMLLGQVHYQLGNHDEARQAIERAVREAEARGESVRENWYLMLRAIHYAQKDYVALAHVLQRLLRRYPRLEYWVQLSAVYGELGDEERQLATLETAYEQHMLEKESEYVMLAQLLLSNGIPYKAGTVLESGLASGKVEATAQTLRMQADAWVLAKEYEKGVAALEKAAARTDGGDLDLRLAQVLLEMERFKEALDAARTAARKGGLEKPETAHVLAGLALYNLDDLDAAAKEFSIAGSFEDASPVVSQWTGFIEKERSRRAALEQAMDVSRNTAKGVHKSAS
ncbi:MAG: tetratricopeptide repeat protein [Proteobacteria bacterium]|nr:tetratricopeptide repeat protein [Pseudomonadota bacterium]